MSLVFAGLWVTIVTDSRREISVSTYEVPTCPVPPKMMCIVFASSPKTKPMTCRWVPERDRTSAKTAEIAAHFALNEYTVRE